MEKDGKECVELESRVKYYWCFKPILGAEEQIHTNLGIALRQVAIRFPVESCQIILTKSGGRSSGHEFTIYKKDDHNIIIGYIYNQLASNKYKDEEYSYLSNRIDEILKRFSHPKFKHYDNRIEYNGNIIVQVSIAAKVPNFSVNPRYWMIVLRLDEYSPFYIDDFSSFERTVLQHMSKYQ